MTICQPRLRSAVDQVADEQGGEVGLVEQQHVRGRAAERPAGQRVVEFGRFDMGFDIEVAKRLDVHLLAALGGLRWSELSMFQSEAVDGDIAVAQPRALQAGAHGVALRLVAAALVEERESGTRAGAPCGL